MVTIMFPSTCVQKPYTKRTTGLFPSLLPFLLVYSLLYFVLHQVVLPAVVRTRLGPPSNAKLPNDNNSFPRITIRQFLGPTYALLGLPTIMSLDIDRVVDETPSVCASPRVEEKGVSVIGELECYLVGSFPFLFISFPQGWFRCTIRTNEGAPRGCINSLGVLDWCGSRCVQPITSVQNSRYACVLLGTDFACSPS